jgi:hypothetical protein
MSAKGQKQTFAPQNVMPALPPKADMCGALVHVHFGPVADILSAVAITLLADGGLTSDRTTVCDKRHGKVSAILDPGWFHATQRRSTRRYFHLAIRQANITAAAPIAAAITDVNSPARSTISRAM